MKIIYEFQSQYYPGRTTWYIFVIASTTEEAIRLVNEKANEDGIPYVFGESDIIFDQLVDDIYGCFELIEA